MPPAFVPSRRQLVPPWRMVLLLLAAFGGCAFGQSLPPVAYYDSALGKTGTVLKAALHEVIKGQLMLGSRQPLVPSSSSAVERPSGNVAVDETFKRAPKAKAKYAAHPELEL